MLGSALILAATQPVFAIKLFGYTFFESEKPPPSPDAKRYSINVDVTTQDTDLADRLRAASQLYADREDTPPPSEAALLSRARAEYARIIATLYNEGYYGGSVSVKVAGHEVDTMSPEVRLPAVAPVSITINPGPAFTFGTVVLKGRAPDNGEILHPRIMTPERAGLVSGEPARADRVITAETSMVEAWRRLGYPKAKALPQQVTADHKTDRLDVTLNVQSGPAAVYGPVAVTGTEEVDPEFVAYMTGLERGRRYSPEEIDRAIQRLRRLQVFSTTRILEADAVEPNGELPLTVQVADRARHVFGGGASWSSIDGAGLEAYWENRNLLGRAEKLRFEGKVSGIDSVDPKDFSYHIAASFMKPGVFTPYTDLTAILSASREVYDPYTQNTFRARIGLAHEFTPRLTGTLSINGEYDQVEDGYEYNPVTGKYGQRDLYFFSLPGSLAYDGSDDKKEPTRGYRARMLLEPFYEAHYGNAGAIVRFDASAYYPFDANGRIVLAGRAAIGSIIGASADQMPADRLFFAGGGGSVRGYAYRSLGPVVKVNGVNQVVGGSSLVEGSLELRVKVTESIGVVPFVDAGGAFESRYPDFKDDIRVGAGIGLRYYTGIGAIRADFAVPVNPPKGASGFGIYLGIGESF